MSATTATPALVQPGVKPGGSPLGDSQASTAFAVLIAISTAHLLNDLVQTIVPSIYPILKQTYSLDFGQIGLITLTFQMTASLLQPVVGTYTDRHPLPFSLPAGMVFTLCGVLLLSVAGSFPMLLLAAGLIGLGSSVFHPESSRVARLASGGRHGLAQSVFQVGGNFGQALGPLMVAFIVAPHGLRSIAWFAAAPILAIAILSQVGRWYSARLGPQATSKASAGAGLPRRKVAFAVSVLLVLIFSKYFYLASLNSYYTFYLIEHFHVSVQQAQVFLFVFLGAVAVGTIAGGPIGDRIGRKYVIWGSILGVLPFTLALPYANLFWTVALTVPIGLVIASAFSAILVYAQELVPGRIGTVSGLFFGFAFGMGGIGAAVLGKVADATSIEHVYALCAWLPLIGLLTAFLPNIEKPRRERT